MKGGSKFGLKLGLGGRAGLNRTGHDLAASPCPSATERSEVTLECVLLSAKGCDSCPVPAGLNMPALLLALFLGVPSLMAVDRYVAHGTNNPDGSYQSWATAASNIHDAVGVAVSGETVWVGPGTYRRAGVASVVDIAKSIHLRGAEGPEHTIIDGENARRGLFIDARTLVDADLLIEGLTIANGRTGGYGGGVSFFHGDDVVTGTGTGVIDNCVITNCEITAEAPYYGGGGVYIRGRTPHSTDFLAVVRDCTISDNRIPGRSGGAGLATRDSLVLVEDCRILNNRMTVSIYSGGGIYMLTPVAGSIVRNSLIAGNAAGDGGGVNVGGGVLIDRCIIRDNLATRYAGGVHLTSSPISVVRNCLVYNNRSSSRGSGIASRGAGFLLENTTVTSNRNTTVGGYGSGGVLLENATDTSYIRNSIIDQNYTAAGGHLNFVQADSVVPVITNSCITAYAALPPGCGNLSVPPEFIDFNAQNFRLSRSSPCIDAGFQQTWMTGARDLGGLPRIAGGAVDMGCYEYHPTGTIISVR